MIDQVADFSSMEEVFSKSEFSGSASEAHGILCGLKCSRGDEDVYLDWCRMLIGSESQLDYDSEKQLQALYDETCNKLHASDFSFQLLMPDDHINIEKRVSFLRDWCQGFLIGFQNKHSMMETENLEILDFISQAATILEEGVEDDDENEASFTEIYEYLRMAVLSLYIPQDKEDS